MANLKDVKNSKDFTRDPNYDPTDKIKNMKPTLKAQDTPAKKAGLTNTDGGDALNAEWRGATDTSGTGIAHDEGDQKGRLSDKGKVGPTGVSNPNAVKKPGSKG
jgi:hypothetical protein